MTQTLSKPIGIVRNMPDTDYHAIDACSHSRLVKMRKTAAHCRHAIDNVEESDQMFLGSVLHCITTTPERFAECFAVSPKFDKRTTAGKAAAAEFEAASAGKRVIDASIMDQASAMRDSITQDRQASKIIFGAGDRELSIFWNDEEVDGLFNKARIDLALWEIGCNFDIKTTRDAGDDAFQSSIWNFGYHLQAAMYEDAAASQGHAIDRFGFILVENVAPYLARVVELDRKAIERGHEALKPLKEKYAECLASGIWPGYSDESITVLSLPAWTNGRI